MITVVAGPCGAGKTTWILTALAEQPGPALYVSPGADGAAIDAQRIAQRFPSVEICDEPLTSELLERAGAGVPVYFELGFHLEVGLPLLEAFPHQRIAVVSELEAKDGWALWASSVVAGNPSTLAVPTAEIWRAPLTGQVLEPASLDMFWQELVQGAYGDVHRAKGLFNLADGQGFYFDFVKGLPGTAYTEMPGPICLTARPSRFSGLEVVGHGLDRGAIAQTLTHCCLSDSLLAAHQASLRESLAEN